MRKLATAVAVSLALASSGVKALGLGDIEMNSALNQPLDAEILLKSVQPGELEGLLVQLASREAFERAGIERSSALTSLKFSVDQKPDGSPYIKIGSSGPVVEPFLNFLLEVDWPKGRMVREYTILLDPPVFMNQEVVSGGSAPTTPQVATAAESATDPAVPVVIDRAAEAAADAMPVAVEVVENADAEVADSVGAATPAPVPPPLEQEVIVDSIAISSDREFEVKTTDAKPLETPSVEPVAQVAPQESAPVDDASAYATEGDAYTVVKNDTLWRIALDNKPTDISVQQMMLALLQANQDAFVDNNVNRLKEGAILRMPSYEQVSARSRGDAVAEMTVQNQLWQEYRDSIGRVASASGGTQAAGGEPSTPAEDATQPAEEPTGEAQAPSEPVAPTETATEQTPSEDPLKIVADPSSSEGVATPNADDSEQPDTAVLGQINTDLTLAREELEAQNLEKEELQAQAGEIQENTEKMERLIELRENELAQLQDQLAGAEETADPVEPATPEPELVEEPPIVVDAPAAEQSFFQKLMADPVKVAGVGVGALGLLGLLGWLFGRKRKDDEEEVVFEEEAFVETDSVEEQTEFPEVAAGGEEVEPLQAFEDEDEGPTELPEIIEGDDDIEGLDDTGMLSGAVDDESAKDDTISEADVYLAYGLHGQAEDLLTKAVDRDPENQEYQLKLLETHHGQKDADRFTRAAQGFHDSFGGGENPSWGRVAEMGRELDPTNALFDAGSVGEASSAGSDAAALAAGIAAGAGLGAAAQALDDVPAEEASVVDEAEDTLALDGFDATGDVTEIIAPPSEDVQAGEMQDASLLDQSMDPGLAFDEADLEATGDFSTVAAELNAEVAAGDVVEGGASLLEEAASMESSLALEDDLSIDVDDALLTGAESVVPQSNDDLGALLDSLGEGDGSEKGSTKVLSQTADAVELEPLNETLSGLEDTGLEFEESVLDLSALGDENTVSADGLEGLELTGSPEELTLDLEDLSEDTAAAASNVETLFDNTEGLDTAFDQTQELEIPDLTANADLTGADDSAALGATNEMETMLDLAKAYIDMGDNDSAASALGEIVKGGSVEQKTTAEELLKKIG